MAFDTKEQRQAALLDEIIYPDGSIEHVEMYWLLGQYYAYSVVLDLLTGKLRGSLASHGRTVGTIVESRSRGDLA